MAQSQEHRVLVTRLTEGNSAEAFGRALVTFAPALPKDVKKICIKVNLCDYRMADSGATTDPALLEVLIGCMRRRFPSAEVGVLEHDGTSVEAHTLFRALGFEEPVKRAGATLLSAADGTWQERPVPRPHVFKELLVPGAWADADLRVNFTKLKTNSLTKTTGCLKNLFGLLKTKKKVAYHNRIDGVVADINQVMHSDLCLVDGLVGQEGLGPAFGTPRRCELLIAGVDPVAVDTCCAKIMGFSPWLIGHIVKCQRAGVGRMAYRLETDIEGFRYSDYKYDYSRMEHAARSVVRRFFHIGAAG
jgi:uncharacterized protein (DUF362 family)